MQIFISTIYGLALAFFVAYALLAVYHAIKFRYLSNRTRKITMTFLVISGITMIASLVFLYMINWSSL